MRIMIQSVLVMSLALAGCAKPTTQLRLGVEPAVAATAYMKPLKGQVTAESQPKCALPCTVAIAPDAKYLMRIDSEGYFPAVFELDHLMAMHTGRYYGDPEQARLIVPLVKRPPKK